MFENKITSATIPNEYIGAVEKGFYEALAKVIFNKKKFTKEYRIIFKNFCYKKVLFT